MRTDFLVHFPFFKFEREIVRETEMAREMLMEMVGDGDS
jgi:hypothetical protein